MTINVLKYSFLNIKFIFCVIIIIFIFYILISKNITETFSQCVYRPKGRQIDSLNLNYKRLNNIITSKDYELSIVEFKDLVYVNNITDINSLNNLKIIKDSGGKYEIIYKINNEMIIHRKQKSHGFHIKLLNNPKKFKVIGIIFEYNILSQYTKNIDDKFHTLNTIINLPN